MFKDRLTKRIKSEDFVEKIQEFNAKGINADKKGGNMVATTFLVPQKILQDNMQRIHCHECTKPHGSSKCKQKNTRKCTTKDKNRKIMV